MTEKIYYQDSEIYEFEAVVLSCEKAENGYISVLDRTAFFPEGGGQTGDVGEIDGIEVFDTQEKVNEVYHYTVSPLEIGKKVHGKVDKNVRFSKMQNHSGEHVVSGIICSKFGYSNVGFHLGKDDMTMDYSGELSSSDIDEVERLANEAIYKNIEIETTFPSSEELKNIDYRSKLDLTENVRIVKIGDIDCCACCAPHVKTTGQIGVIKITEYIRYKGGMRLHARCGFEGYKVFGEYQQSVTKIAGSLSAKRSEVTDAFDRVVKESEEKSRQITELNKKIVDMTVENIKDGQKNVCLFFDGADMNTMRAAANKAKEKCEHLCAVFSGSDDLGYRYCIASTKNDLKDLAKDINTALNGKGGGNGEMISGNTAATKEKINKFFETEIGEK